MLQIHEMLELSITDNFKLISGKAGLKNEFTNIVILEYESTMNNFEDFHPGDFVLTSLFFAKDHPERIPEAFHCLMERKVAAIAVKTVFYQDIPQDIQQLSEQAQVPIFTFHDTYMEDLIICASNLLKSKQEYLMQEEKIKSILSAPPSPYLVSNVAKEINPSFYEDFFVTYFTRKEDSSHTFVSTFFNSLLYKKYRNSAPYSFVKYKDGILFLYSYRSEDTPSKIAGILSPLFASFGLSLQDFYQGISNSFHSMVHLHIAIQQSIFANLISQLKQITLLSYSQLGIYQYILPLLHDTALIEINTKNMSTLIGYDTKHTSDLVDTLKEYVANHGEIAKTAKALYQHPNTIRYRLKKACTLINGADFTGNFYEQAFLMIHLCELQNLPH